MIDPRNECNQAISAELDTLHRYAEACKRAEEVGLRLDFSTDVFVLTHPECGAILSRHTLSKIEDVLGAYAVGVAMAQRGATPKPDGTEAVVVSVEEISGPGAEAVAHLVRTVVDPNATKQDRLTAAAGVLNAIWQE